MVTRRNPVLRAGEMFDGDETVSESRTLATVKVLLEGAVRALHYQPTATQQRQAARDIEQAHTLVRQLLTQASRGVHVNPARRHRANPALVIYGNPGRRVQGGEVCLSKGQVQAIIYTHERDGSDRVHGFGDADIQLSNDGDALVIEGLEAHTGVSMYGLPDKRRIVVRGDDDQKVWDYFPEGE